MTHLIEITALTKTFGTGSGSVEALKGIDLYVDEGEIFGVIGLSGAGKSTLIRCLNRLETPTSGRVVVAGRDLTTLNDSELLEARRGMGMIFQSFNLLSLRNVWSNVAFPLEMAGRPAPIIHQRVAELLEMVGLSDKAKNYPAQLSGGQKQRVGIARALANSPSILLCDEATSSLDPQTTASILSLIEDLKERLRLTVVLITHEMKVITEICDRVAVMEDGRIVETGQVIEVFTAPKHPTSKSFVEVVLSNREHFLEKGYRPKGILVRVGYIGAMVVEPLVYTLVKKFDVEANILQAHVDHIKGTPYGTLLLDLAGDTACVALALDYLKSSNVNLEVFDDPDSH
ncbi:MAG: ATP-binding cassette domain-containing protein [Deltaproteobacteria bacterium]|jgi:D-methionine transport system ATP-binding protein|nr:ATP-binding cassette domain-containing protein [Deltaproteobacteria bacterium]